MPKQSLQMNSSGTIQLITGVGSFPKGICQKVNIIARLEFEVAFDDVAVHHLSHYATGLPPHDFWTAIYVI